MTISVAKDFPVFQSFRALLGSLDANDVARIKTAIATLDATGSDKALFELFATMDDDDRVSPYEFETLKSGFTAYLANSVAPVVPLASETPAAGSGTDQITVKVMQEILGHESLVLEAYRDSRKIWTAFVGVTSVSGHSVKRYIDNPQTIEKAIAVYAWLLREKYAPGVLRAFKGRKLTEAQFAAALSFHYNTGAIENADWVQSWLAGKTAKAKKEFMNYRRPKEIVKRREAERDLFFDSKWTSDGKTMIYPVSKPSYSPAWSKGKKVDITAKLRKALV